MLGSGVWVVVNILFILALVGWLGRIFSNRRR